MECLCTEADKLPTSDTVQRQTSSCGGCNGALDICACVYPCLMGHTSLSDVEVGCQRHSKSGVTVFALMSDCAVF